MQPKLEQQNAENEIKGFSSKTGGARELREINLSGNFFAIL